MLDANPRRPQGRRDVAERVVRVRRAESIVCRDRDVVRRRIVSQHRIAADEADAAAAVGARTSALARVSYRLDLGDVRTFAGECERELGTAAPDVQNAVAAPSGRERVHDPHAVSYTHLRAHETGR